MAKNSYTALQDRPIYKQTMDDDVVVTAVDAILQLVKSSPDGTGVWPFRLAAQTQLSITQVRHLLKLARYSRRADVLWPGHRLAFDQRRGYRVSDVVDEVSVKQVLGATKCAETRLRHEVADILVVNNLPDVLRLFGQMAESRANELAAMRTLVENMTPASV